MLPAPHRLRSSAEFRTTVRRGRRSAGRALVVHLLPPEEPPPSSPTAARPARVGLVVSRAVGPAVTRNLVKRRLRHLLRDRVASLPPGSTLVVRALPAAAGTPYASLGEEIDRLLRLDPDLAAERMVTC